MDAYKKTGLYNEVKLAQVILFLNVFREKNLLTRKYFFFKKSNIPPKYFSQGVAPFCALRDFNCDLVENNKYPVGAR